MQNPEISDLKLPPPIRSVLLAIALFCASSFLAPAADTLSFTARSRIEKTKGSGEYEVVEKAVQWNAAKTAIIICDMWDQHWCKGASERVAEMAPVMNRVVGAARRRGVLIIHAPSETMDFYKD